eukprot:2743814-Ditylum_brightwellii.AAC.1
MLALKVKQKSPTMIFEDSTAAIMMANASKLNGRTCHIDISCLAIQEWVEKGEIKLAHIRGVVNPSESLTKVLGWTLCKCHVSRMMGHVGSRFTNTS